MAVDMRAQACVSNPPGPALQHLLRHHSYLQQQDPATAATDESATQDHDLQDRASSHFEADN